MTIKPGARLGPYEITAFVGAGGMGEVYRARDTRLGREVAIKVLPAEVTADPGRIERFEREVRALATLSHPNILAIYDFGREGTITYAVTELLEGETLRKRLGREHLPWRKAAEIAAAIGDGIAAAHGKGIIHRDLKPDNVFITSDGRVKILDFGLARLEVHALPDVETLTCPAPATLAGTVLGTIGYMAPEQVRGEAANASSDIFALGCVLYEMLTSERAFKRDTAAETMAATLTEDPPQITTLQTSVPVPLAKVANRCLEKRPEERFGSARDLAFDLRAIVAQTSGAPADLTAVPFAGRRRSARLAAGGVAALAVAAGAVLLLQRFGGRSASESAEVSPQVQSLAVLPFANLSADKENEYFGDGLAENIIDALAQVPGLRVMARTSAFAFRGKETDVREIGARLNVEHILEGSVRRSGSRIRVTAQLVKASDGYHVWSQRFDREMADVFTIQDEISQAIVKKLRVGLADDRPLVKRHTENIEAYHLFLRGRHSVLRMTPESLAKGREYLEQAVALDPDYALAYAGLAEQRFFSMIFGHMDPMQALVDAKWAATEALERDDTLAEAHAMLGVVLGTSEFDWAGAEREFRRALELNPASPTVSYCYGFWLLRPTGRLDEALSQLQRAVELDPLSPHYNAWLGHVYHLKGQSDLAIAQHKRAIELDPGLWRPHMLLAAAYGMAARFPEAIAEARTACELAGRSALPVAVLAVVYGTAGRPDEARALLEELTTRARTTHVPPYAMALAYSSVGEFERALDWLETGVERRDVLVVCELKSGLVTPPLHLQTRYHALLRKVNLEQ